ncbi:hypothetical protein A9D60_24395 [Leisingera sp. JC1]|nr:hypothetical protein A9D60_24395 [Leisingera sp. JC1]
MFLGEGDQFDPSFDQSGRRLAYFFHNSVDAVNSVALIDFRDVPDVSQLGLPDSWSPQGQDLIEVWSVILLLQNLGSVEGGVAVISSEQDTERAVSYLKYHLVMSGHRLTLPVPLVLGNRLSDVQDSLVVEKDYTQFVEPFGMLGEVNSRESVLEGFLSTYHVLENYMIRSEVSSALSNTTGRSFQRVRDFKRLGQQTDASEVSHLTKLFKQCWDKTIGATTLSAYLENTFNTTKADPRWNENDFDKFLVELGVLNGSGNQVTFANGFNNAESVRNNFAKLVYSIRCSIVHNKATEFHLSNEELSREAIRVLVIVELCLPVMQRIAFGLPSSAPSTNPIFYVRRELMFY